MIYLRIRSDNFRAYRSTRTIGIVRYIGHQSVDTILGIIELGLISLLKYNHNHYEYDTNIHIVFTPACPMKRRVHRELRILSVMIGLFFEII